MQNPHVSIVIPAFNEENNIESCLFSLMDQTMLDSFYEIIVVDNGSTDRTLDLVKKYPVRWFLKRKRGPACARNKGIENAKGEVIAFIDADCIAHKDWIKEAMKVFEKCKEAGCVGGKTLNHEPSNLFQRLLKETGSIGAKDGPITTYPYPYFPTLNVFYKRDVFKKIGFFDESLKTGEDVDICWRMQFYSDYQLKFSPGSIVYHNLKKDAFSLFKQRRAYAMGRVFLYKKHNRMLPKRSIREIYWGYENLFRSGVELIVSGITCILKKNLNDAFCRSWIRFLILLATKTGHISGSIKHRFFYL